MVRGKQKSLRLSPDERLLLDTIRQYLNTTSETEAGVVGIRTLGEQLIASYLEAGTHPQRCNVLFACLNAAAHPATSGAPATYQMDLEGGNLYRWHDPTASYYVILPAIRPWLPIT